MDSFTRNIILFVTGALFVSIALIFAIRRFSKLNIKAWAKAATLLGFIGIAVSAYILTDLRTFFLTVIYSIPVAGIAGMIIWKNREELNKIPKGVVQLSVVCSLFLWRWLHSVSVVLEFTLGFAVCFIAIAMAFLLDEKFWRFESH
jgi:hypothetical protein